MGRNGHLRAEKKVPLKKMHENHGFLHVQQLSGCIGTPRQASGAQKCIFYFFLSNFFFFLLADAWLTVLETNFMAQLGTRARFPRSTHEITPFFSSEMNTDVAPMLVKLHFFFANLHFPKGNACPKSF